MSFGSIFSFEKKLATYTGAKFAIMTDCCTHALELCFRYDRVTQTEFTAFTYLSVIQIMHRLDIKYTLTDEKWIGEYQFKNTRIWDSARRLEKDMYCKGQMQCLSFGHTKPIDSGRGGAILLDDARAYDIILRQRYDGRDLNISPWQDQVEFHIGYHYRPTIEEAIAAESKLDEFVISPKKTVYIEYPDCRKIIFKE